MANWEVGESSLANNYVAMEISKHQRPVLFLQPTTSEKAYPVSIPNLPFATPYPNGPLNTDLVVVAQGKPHTVIELDPLGSMDEQEWRKVKKRLQNRDAARKSKVRKKREYEELQAKVKAISRETTKLRENITRHSEEIEDLRTENKTLLEELRNVCDEVTISRLESMNPENSGQDRQASYESNQNTDTSPSSDHSYHKSPSGTVNSSPEEPGNDSVFSKLVIKTR